MGPRVGSGSPLTHSFRVPVLLVAALVMSAPACSGDKAANPVGPRYLDVAMSEFRFEVAGNFESGRTVLNIRNVGQAPHEFILEELPTDFPPLDEQIRSPRRRGLPTLAFVRREPGASRTLAVDLAPGRYAIVCFIRDADGISHALKGMNAELRVQ
jgi:uncharacterized cupredoxin-like copper-binding protein